MSKTLTRSRSNKMLAGVCGGLAEYLGADPTLIRVGYIILALLSAAFPGLLVYILLWVIVPEEE